MPQSNPAPPTAPCPISRAEFARRAGKGKSRITTDCGVKGLLHAACLLNGDIDVVHPAVVAWATKRGIPLERLQSEGDGAQLTASAAPLPSNEPSREQFNALAFRKKAAEVEKLELQNARARGRLISRQLVKAHVFGALERLHLQLLTSVAVALPARLAALARANASPEELQKVARELFERELKEARRQSAAGLSRASRAARSNEPLPELDDEDEDDELPGGRPAPPGAG